MNKNTFGSVEKYKMLGFLVDNISPMEDKHRAYLSSVIGDINVTVKKLN